mmetsp:Transcript_111268/g.227793  ORF Transcript_111268/g.227793 Transcript_111268/m.227793 type:complete len:681 (+) Transcript_111268:878-2920(+)|eukprot:CAMPEP_0201116566 /NCGR_PEP_ID=MMETSP0850-20130426/793_1 /ASSEMBLY_ACC=CAM_ASM_000622 /TAXON_ID=183588 /ORGANISM="Pseudo-nitzschia fraudulenta, Strain WWA7" /LENGTH=680 /DNA_ID=CAMNT_0047380671 /DNA_START=141 /DNA_END=2183 /DNA_ORIENTATION=+
MKFFQTTVSVALASALALAVCANGEEDNHHLLRGLAASRHQNTFKVGTYKEELGSCKGAVCGLWGDPHMITCDGLQYDCQGAGLFTLMKNAIYNIQGHFVSVGAVEMRKLLKNNKRRFAEATITNDIIVNYTASNDVPVMQFSYPNLGFKPNEIPSHVGCMDQFHYEKIERTTEDTIVDCRKRCEDHENCGKFTYFEDKGCHLALESAKLKAIPKRWSNSHAGPVDKCGHPEKVAARTNAETPFAKDYPNGMQNRKKNQKRKADDIGCPVLFYMDGVLQDISNKEDGEYLYGGPDSDHSVKLHGFNQIKIVNKMESGAASEIMLETNGQGIGELFSCSFNFFVCLPESEQTTFETGGTGLLGSPDGNTKNDWMTPDGTVLSLPKQKKGRAAFDYCRDNWCVSQNNSMMAYPEGSTYEDVKCQSEEYVEFDVNDCGPSADYIIKVCENLNPLMAHQCQVDCCNGSCANIAETETEVGAIVRQSGDPGDVIYDSPASYQETPTCDGDAYERTGADVCPSSPESVVEVFYKSADIPAGKPIIYGIDFIDSVDEDKGPQVKFRVNNPFEKIADTFVRYEEKVGLYANDPKCIPTLGLDTGCKDLAPTITAGCIEAKGIEPFALVDVYFASKEDPFVSAQDKNTKVEKCCKPPPSYEEADSGFGVVMYTFKILCSCPAVAAANRN